MSKDFSYKFYKTTSEAWEAMYEAVLAADRVILWETYIFVDNDETGKKFLDALCLKAGQGVEVRMIIDAIGSLELSDVSLNRLRGCGVKVLRHNDPLRFSWKLREWLRRIWQRSHRKLLIIDDEVAFVGGVNVEKSAVSWEDLQMRLTGKILRQLSYRFAKDYVRSGGDRKEVRKWLRPKRAAFEKLKEKVKFILHYPVLFGHKSKVKSLYYKSLALAKESFTLVTPYYAPDMDFLRLITEAKNRGVKVNIIAPLRPDVWIFKMIGQVFLEASVRAGATVYQLPFMNHAKAVGVDKKMGIVGSANLTPRSMFWNRESGVIFEEKEMVEELNGILDDWKSRATVLGELKSGRKGVVKRFWSWLAHLLRDYV